jgi:hypothetical protein
MLAGLQRHAGPNGSIASGDLQRIVAEKTSYGPQNVGRRLRELAEKGSWTLCMSAITRITGQRKSEGATLPWKGGLLGTELR